MKKYVLAVNNRNGLNALEVVKKNLGTIEAIIVHPEERSAYRHDIISAANLDSSKIITYQKSKIPEIIKTLKAGSCEILLSVNFGYIIPPDILQLFEHCFNLHTGYLPWNKGAHPNVWPLIDSSPAGVALHIMTPQLDEGDIVYREKVEVWETDNAKTLYEKLESLSPKVLLKGLEGYFNKELKPFKPECEGTYHNHKEFLSLFEIDLDKKTSAGELINLMKALSYPPYKNAYYIKNGEKYFIDITLEKDKKC